jgi:hypothetical protein
MRNAVIMAKTNTPPSKEPVQGCTFDEAVKAGPPFGSIRKAAEAVYTPPFYYQHGYIRDSSHLIVADDGELAEHNQSVKGAVAARIRGWGRLGYLPNGAQLQDEIGNMIADALNQYYEVRDGRNQRAS